MLEIIRKFTASYDIRIIPLKENGIFRAGNLVLKPVTDSEEYLWTATTLHAVDFERLKFAKPVLSLYGNYIEDGFGATQFFEECTHKYDFEEGLSLCRELNRILARIKINKKFPNQINNPWKLAHQLAWDKNLDYSFPEPLRSLLKLKKPIDFPKQLIHADLAGNILANDSGKRCVIDFTPAFFPKEYAEAIMIVDYISLHNASISLIENINLQVSDRMQIILRALIFRMSVSLFFENQNPKGAFSEDLKYYEKLVKLFAF